MTREKPYTEADIAVRADDFVSINAALDAAFAGWTPSADAGEAGEQASLQVLLFAVTPWMIARGYSSHEMTTSCAAFAGALAARLYALQPVAKEGTE